MATKIVAVKLTATEIQAIDDLIMFGVARTRSHALREGLMRFFDEHKLKFEARLAIRQERIKHRMRKARKDAADDS